MSEKYLEIQREHLSVAWARGTEKLARALPAKMEGECLLFDAFGEECRLWPDEIRLGEKILTGPRGILVALYARYARDLPQQLEPLISFKELPGSGPYQGAFTMRSEQALAPHVPAIHERQEAVVEKFSGQVNKEPPSGDFSFTLFPLPRIPLYYMFYLPDEEFGASVTCLFAADAADHLTVDGLADVAEYTAKGIIGLVR